MFFMKKMIIAFLSLLLILSGCSEQTPEADKKTVDLYFLNAEGNAMVVEAAQVPEGTDDILTFALEKLLDGPKDIQHKKALPDGVKYNSIRLDNDIATIDLSAEFNYGTNVEQLMRRYTVISTACSVQGVSKAQLLVNGEMINSLSTGKPLSAMGKEDIVTDSAQVTNDKVVLTLYFSDDNAMYLVPEARQVSLKEGERMTTLIVEELLKGPVNKSLLPTLSPDIKVLSTETKDSVCFVNLSSEFVSSVNGGSAGEMLAVYSLVNSLCEVKEVRKVQILAEGKKIESFGHIDLSEPFEKNESILIQNAKN